MMTLKSVGAFSAVLLIFSIYHPCASAQQSTLSTVTIKVTDRSGASVSKAHIRIVPYPLELSRALVTDYQGVVNVQLAQGQYEVFARATAFRPSSKTFEVADANGQTVTVTLDVGEGSGPAVITSPLSGDEQQVWELENALWKYVANVEVDKYEALWEVNSVAWREPPGYYLIGKKDATAWLRIRRAAKLQLYEYDLSPAEVRVIGDTAVAYYWVNTLWLDELGQGNTKWHRVVHTWTKVDKQWRLVGEFLDLK
jgi:hypothetical protein